MIKALYYTLCVYMCIQLVFHVFLMKLNYKPSNESPIKKY